MRSEFAASAVFTTPRSRTWFTWVVALFAACAGLRMLHLVELRRASPVSTEQRLYELRVSPSTAAGVASISPSLRSWRSPGRRLAWRASTHTSCAAGLLMQVSSNPRPWSLFFSSLMLAFFSTPSKPKDLRSRLVIHHLLHPADGHCAAAHQTRTIHCAQPAPPAPLRAAPLASNVRLQAYDGVTTISALESLVARHGAGSRFRPGIAGEIVTDGHHVPGVHASAVLARAPVGLLSAKVALPGDVARGSRVDLRPVAPPAPPCLQLSRCMCWVVAPSPGAISTTLTLLSKFHQMQLIATPRALEVSSSPTIPALPPRTSKASRAPQCPFCSILGSTYHNRPGGVAPFAWDDHGLSSGSVSG